MTDTTVAKEPRKAVAKHYILDKDGAVTEDERLARGARYHHLASGDTIDRMINEKNIFMLAWFGAKTLMTNEASAVRQNEGDDVSPKAAIESRFDLLDQGEWIDRTREVGAKIDYDALTAAFAEAQLGAGRITPDGVEAFKVKYRPKLEAESALRATVRSVPEVQAAYARLVGKPAKTVDDLANLV